MMNESKIKKIGSLLSSTDIFLIALAWLIILTIAGTIAQRSIGLYQAQSTYFSSLVIWYKFIPLPGGRLTLYVIFINLLFKLIYDTKITKMSLGILITHVGGLVLFFGGFLTAYFSDESSLVIKEGQTRSTIVSSHQFELAVINTSRQDVDEVTVFRQGLLKPGKTLAAPQLPLRITIDKRLANCTVTPRPAPAAQPDQGFGRNYILEPAPPANEDGANRPGLSFTISGSHADGRYIATPDMNPQTITTATAAYQIVFRKAETRLPFAITLHDFVKEFYPGTGMPKSYRSTIDLIDKDVKRKVVISMNQPLRYRGYTFYQSSYVDAPQGQETSILSVVHNIGRHFPYISSVIMCFGMLVHLALQVPGIIKQQ